MKVLQDARRLNSNTDKAVETWPKEPLAPQIDRANRNSNLSLILCMLLHILLLMKKQVLLQGFCLVINS